MQQSQSKDPGTVESNIVNRLLTEDLPCSAKVSAAPPQTSEINSFLSAQDKLVIILHEEVQILTGLLKPVLRSETSEEAPAQGELSAISDVGRQLEMTALGIEAAVGKIRDLQHRLAV
jgi:hypothetical protein